MRTDEGFEEGENELAEDPEIRDEGADGEKFEMSPEQATSMEGGRLPLALNRKKLLIFIMCGLAAVVMIGLVSNLSKSGKKEAGEARENFQTAGNNRDFLAGLQNRALSGQARQAGTEQADSRGQALGEDEEGPPEPLLPPVTLERQAQPQPQPQTQPQPQPQPARQASGGGGSQQADHFKSPLVPAVQGSLFSQGQAQPAGARETSPGGRYGDYYDSLMERAAGISAPATAREAPGNSGGAFHDGSTGGSVYGGLFLGDHAVWTGTVITGVLETAINTDLPGNVLARINQNVYDSRTGTLLLIPQGTLLLARYNSSVSFAQSRVQIAWDTMIRPDGYQIELGGAPGVDPSGMSGQPARVDENWFEYAKAAGIIAVFSFLNAKLTESAAAYADNGSGATAGNFAASNTRVLDQLGGGIVERAMDIRPTLTVENGTVISVLLNKTLYLPPVDAYPAAQKYRLE